MKGLLLTVLVLVFVVAGCQKESSVNGPEKSNNSSQLKASWQQAAETQGLKFISLQKQSGSALSKTLSDTKYARVNSFTVLSIVDRYRAAGRYASIKAFLTIFPYALNENTYLTMSFDDTYMMGDVDLTFGPHGVCFNKPALLNVEATGLDFSGFAPTDKLKLYYFNETTGVWEQMQADDIRWDFETGYLKCVNGRLPHFSRYGFTR